MRIAILAALAMIAITGGTADARPRGKEKPKKARWQTAPAPAAMPPPDRTGDLAIDDFTLHYALYGKGEPVVLLHGGLGTGDDYGNLVPALSGDHLVIVVDSRGHGRSSRSAHGISYHLMAGDVVALLDALKLEQAAIVGWSDGGIVGLDLAIHQPARVARLFVIGTNYDLSGMKSGSSAATFSTYFARCRAQYKALSPAPDQLAAFTRELRAMWKTQPTYTADELQAIAVPVTVALGDHDEIIRRDHVEAMAKLIPGAKLVILTDASHFAMWQDPEGFNAAVRAFLQ